MKRKNKKVLYGLFILLLIISVGYAILYTTLGINGTSILRSNSWNVYWDNVGDVVAYGNTIVNTPARVKSGDNTTVEYNVTLDEPGDYYEFTVDAVNAGTLNAMIESISSTVNGEDISTLPPYVKYSVKYADGVKVDEKHLLAKKSGNTETREKYKVRIEFLRSINNTQYKSIPEGGLSYNFNFTVKYVQADETAKAKPAFALPDDKTATTLAFGDELCLQEQCFRFIKYDGTKAVLLANYNLNVGTVVKGSETFLQDSDIKGYYIDNSHPEYGKVDFAKSSYWHDYPNGTIKSEYGSSYPADVYDPENYSGDPSSDNYSVAYYVEEYKTLLEGMGAVISEARLLTKTEAMNDIGCTSGNCSAINDSSTFPGTTFWLATADMDLSADCILFTGGIYNGGACRYGFGVGVRPVILVDTSNL